MTFEIMREFENENGTAQLLKGGKFFYISLKDNRDASLNKWLQYNNKYDAIEMYQFECYTLTK